MMKYKIILLVITVFLIIGCGDQKSTGEKFGEAVTKLREKTPLPTPTAPSIDANHTKNQDKKITASPSTPESSSKNSLKDIAQKAKEKIGDLVKPAKELKEDLKGAISITKESVKEVIHEKKDEAKEGLLKVKAFAGKTKEKLKDEAKKIQSLIKADQAEN